MKFHRILRGSFRDSACVLQTQFDLRRIRILPLPQQPMSGLLALTVSSPLYKLVALVTIGVGVLLALAWLSRADPPR